MDDVVVETFIVRIWTPAPELASEVPSGALRGNVEHVASKQVSRFGSGVDLVSILAAALESAPLPHDSPEAGLRPD